MDLEELQKRLYSDKPEFEKRAEAPKEFEPGQRQGAGQRPVSGWKEESIEGKKPWLSDKQKKILKYSVIGLIVVLVGVGGFLFWRSLSSFDNSKVTLQIFGTERIASGEEVNYSVTYKNNTKISLRNVKLTFVYPEGALPVNDSNLAETGNLPTSVIDLPDLGPGEEGKKNFKANVVGLKDEKKNAKAVLNYYPANVSASYENSAEFNSVIFSVPLILDFDLPERIVNGQEMTITLKYLNTSEIAFSDLVLSVEYPQGFTFNSSSPSPSEGSASWQLAEIGPKEEGKIIVVGVLSGARDEVKSFKAKLEMKSISGLRLVSERPASCLISVSPLTVKTEVNGARDYLANIGEELRYKITYQNTADVPINSAFIALKFDAKVLDYATLKIKQGFFNNLDSSITWNESFLPDLKSLPPGQEKTIEFTVKIKNTLPIANFNDKNFLITTSVKIDSSNIPVSLRGTQLAGTDSLGIKLNSKLIFSSKGYYQDPNNLMPNSGPIPPIVGQQTTYTIYWQVINVSNDVDNVTVESYLPPYVKWLNKFEPKDANIKYDQNTGKISWFLGKLPANTGILSPVKQAVFQIGFIPASNQIGSIVTLIKEAVISGKDLFTEYSLGGKAQSILSDLPDDPSVDIFNGQVKAQ